MRFVMVLALLGCGRFGFDPPGSVALDAESVDDAAGLDTSTNDATTDARPIDLIGGLILWYRLDEPTFLLGAADGTAGNRPGTCNAASDCPSSRAGRVSSAAGFDRANSQRLRTAYDSGLATSTGFTIAVFVNPGTVGGTNQTVIGKPHAASATANTFQLEFVGSQSITFKTRGSIAADEFIVSPGSVAPTTWSHIAASWDGATMRLYMDGTEVASTAFTSLLVDNGDICIACDINSGVETSFFDGGLDDVRLYDRALTSAEIILLAAQ